ncbi:MAG: FAD binding domain-containing protein [Chloroflexia bacterium]
MNNFTYIKTQSLDEALQTLQTTAGAAILAGGTDLIPLVKDDIASPLALVDISSWKEGSRIEPREGGLHIGPLTTLSAIASNETVRAQYPALAQACELAASPQLRNMGTLGGNLLQQTRCWYYRGPYNCWLKGGDTCYARQGENEYHSIFATDPQSSPCVSAHPSDPAVALLALDAQVRFRTPSAEQAIPLDQLYALPTPTRRTFVTLPEGAIITAITLPPAHPYSKSTYVKAMARAAWAFSLAGVAIDLQLDGSQIQTARVALGGVAPIPFRPPQLEAALTNSNPNDLDPDDLASLLTQDARPLSHNRYKIRLLKGIFKEALGNVLG